jgi:diguanylate cyclase (GGDEF)-like protein
MNKQTQIYRIINYCPWPGIFSLLEIFIFFAGLFAAVFLFRFLSSLNTIYGSMFIGQFNMILSLGTGCVLFIVSLILWRKWTVIQNFTTQKQAEDALTSANQKLTEDIAALEQRAQEMDLFRQMIDLLSTCPNIEEAYKIIGDQLGKLNLANSGALYLMKPSRNSLHQVAAWGENASDYPVFSPGDCWGLRRGSLHIAEFNCLRDGAHHANPLICPHIVSTMPADYLCFPLVAQGETLGILQLRHFINRESIESVGTSKRWFTPQRVQRINILAGSLALAIANLMLRSTLRQQSIRDPLTGLYNRRYLEETLERELLRASRNKRKVGLMMIDIDHFKQFNDTCGHPAADRVLSAISHLFTSCIRREDLVCRYGGEEILIMLPETDLETTWQRAQMIREKVAQLHVQYQGQVLGATSISIGIGIFPDHGQTPEALIHSADKALYRAKNNGRNRVEVAAPTFAEPQPDPWQQWQSQVASIPQ